MKSQTAETLFARLARPRFARSRRLPVPLAISRKTLPRIVRKLGFTRGAEVGVWRGAYSALFCEEDPSIHMLCVDPWVSYPAWLDTKNALPLEEAQTFMAQSYADAVARLSPLNATIVRAFSVDAARDVPDGSLDFVYIDGNHVEAAVLEDLAAWSPKVRRGGIVAGHDYRVFKNKPTIHVVEAVQAFTRAHAIAPWYITEGDRTPSFLWVKG